MSKPKRPPPTDRQLQVLAFMKEFGRDNGMPPTIREIANHFGWKSENAVMDHMKALYKRGLVKNHQGKSRGWVPS